MLAIVSENPFFFFFFFFLSNELAIYNFISLGFIFPIADYLPDPVATAVCITYSVVLITCLINCRPYFGHQIQMEE
ncbi:hypothetical protein AB205_0122710 [Aquarana catesbeiana]|uniref:Uncharacterized protein n=1 Tax=Aquarana catesbeiana TaxID=8400 RepID=A0A2G9RT21_AQUCT|nr:hypothetical protein AB205_0122710 [Aquarana catesbeiana]